MCIPAGIEEGFNIYRHGDDLRVMIDGQRSDYVDLPQKTRSIFCDEMNQSKKVIEALMKMGCAENETQELKFVGCRYGGLNETPDLVNGKTFPDPPQCENIGDCPGYGTVCVLPCRLTRKEYRVATLVAKGKQDKEICYSLGITLSTCRTYFARIHNKLSINNKMEIALWAQKMGIV